MGKAIALPANNFQRQMWETGGIPAPAGLAVPQAIRAIGEGGSLPAAGPLTSCPNPLYVLVSVPSMKSLQPLAYSILKW